jgi:uncharacterized protein
VEPGEKCICDACPIWQRSEYALQPNLNIIGNVSSNTSILILQGENYTQTFKNVLVFCYMVFFL